MAESSGTVAANTDNAAPPATPDPVKPAASAPNPAAAPLDSSTTTVEVGKDGKMVPPAPVIPESYKFLIPKDSPLNQTQIEKIAAHAKSTGMTQEAAQAYLNERSSDYSSFITSQTTAMKEQSKQWIEELRNDKDFGGDAFNENVELAKRYVDTFFPDEVKKVLNETGLGNHPGLVRGMIKAQRALKTAEDKYVQSRGVTQDKSSPEKVFYGAQEK